MGSGGSERAHALRPALSPHFSFSPTGPDTSSLALRTCRSLCQKFPPTTASRPRKSHLLQQALLIALAPMIILSFEIPGHLPSVPSFNLTHIQHTCALGRALSWSQGDSAVDWAERSSLLPLCGRQASAHCDSAETQDSVGDSDAWRLRGESPQLSGG